MISRILTVVFTFAGVALLLLGARIFPHIASDSKPPSLEVTLKKTTPNIEKSNTTDPPIPDVDAAPITPQPKANIGSKKPSKNGLDVVRAKVADNPELLLLYLQSYRASQAIDWNRLFQRLHLSTEQITQVEDALVDYESEKAKYLGSDLKNLDALEIKKLKDADTVSYKDKVRAILGDDNYKAFIEYSKTLPIENVVNDYASSLQQVQTELSDAQTDQLVALLAANSAHNQFGWVEPNTVDWDKVLPQVGTFLSKEQLQLFAAIAEQARINKQLSKIAIEAQSVQINLSVRPHP